MNNDISRCVECYAKVKNLKLVGNELNIPWQTVYVHLKSAGVPVVGDKSRYGSDSDRLAAKGEAMFMRLVPFARDMNMDKFQPKIDFDCRGYGVDIKTSSLKKTSEKGYFRWSFSIKKQSVLADFFVLFAMDGDSKSLAKCFLIPGEVAKHYTTISISKERRGKWMDYEVEPSALSAFFESLPTKPGSNHEAD